MFRKSLIALCLGLTLAGCSSVRSYDSIADNVEYTYDQDLKQSVTRGPIESGNYTSNAKVDSFAYNISVLNTDLVANIDLKYTDSDPRQFTHIVDSTGRGYKFITHTSNIDDCGIAGTFKSGRCDFSDQLSFNLPRENRYQYTLVSRTGKNINFAIQKNYIAVMSDVVYRMKTPRADYAEETIRKDTLVAAKPVPVAKPVVQMPPKVQVQPVIQPPVVTAIAPVEPIKVFKPRPAPAIAKKPAPVAVGCVPGYEAKPLVKKVQAKKPVKKAVLTPVKKSASCTTMKAKSCSQIKTCREAYDQLACGNKKVDPDNNGIPCQAICRLPLSEKAKQH